MNEFGDWLSSNWYEAGTLLLHAAILVTLIWYVRKSVRLKTASLQPFETQRRESLTFRETEPDTSFHTERVVRRGPSPLRRFTHWLQTPIGS